MSRFAAKTTVSSEKSRSEIEAILTRYGASAFMYAWEGPRAVIGFRAKERHIRFTLPLPDSSAKEFTHSSRGPRSPDAVTALWEQACRQSWRALALVIKAKLEAVEAGIVEFESEFLAHIVLPDGSTVGAWVRPQVAIAYQSGDMPKMLPDHSQS